MRLAVIAVLLASASLCAASPPQTLTVGGRMTLGGGPGGRTWKVYALADSSLAVTGIGGSTWMTDVGDRFAASASDGNELICVFSKSTGVTTPPRGYYGVMNHTLTGDDPAVFSTITLRTIPAPSVTSDALAHLTWSTVVEDPGEGGAANIIGYNVFRSSDGNTFTQVNTTVVMQTNYDDAISGDQPYYYAISPVYRGNPPVNCPVISDNSPATVKDSDNDGLPDYWMLNHFGHATGQATDHSLAIDDADGDGQNNLHEFLAGTNPTNSASAFRILTAEREGDDVRVTWLTVGGHTNAVQAAPSVSGAYSDVSSNILITGGSDTTTNYLDLGGETNFPARFYRVRLVP